MSRNPFKAATGITFSMLDVARRNPPVKSVLDEGPIITVALVRIRPTKGDKLIEGVDASPSKKNMIVTIAKEAAGLGGFKLNSLAIPFWNGDFFGLRYVSSGNKGGDVVTLNSLGGEKGTGHLIFQKTLNFTSDVEVMERVEILINTSRVNQGIMGKMPKELRSMLDLIKLR